MAKIIKNQSVGINRLTWNFDITLVKKFVSLKIFNKRAFVQKVISFVEFTLVHIRQSNLSFRIIKSEQGQGKVKARSRQGQGKAKARSWQGQGKVKARLWQGQGMVKARSRQGHGKVKARSRQS